MNKKTVIQVLMVILFILISLLFYLKYFNKSLNNKEDSEPIKKVDINQNNSSTYIDNIDYISSDTRGNRYQITAEQAEIKIENSDIMYLENVVSYIFMNDTDMIKITSDFGKYNSKNYDTIFSKNVILIYPGHKITGE